MTTQLAGNKCEGGHYTCSPPKECCYKGCCFLLAPSVYKPPSIQSGNVFNPLFLGHWYFWLAVTATVAGILCACSLWRKHSQGTLCCRDTGRDERASEPDSNGSCYAPPQYSRCNSFHQPPPPYSEVTSKPDLYPLVINYNADPVIKNNNTSTGYLMVQYFRNFIVRPVGSLSAASTNDSISSSFLCNAANEANNIIPPPYSNVGSLEEVTSSVPIQASPASSEGRIARSASTLSNATTEYHQTIQRSPSDNTQLTLLPPLPPFTTPTRQPSPVKTPMTANINTAVVQIRNNPCFIGQQNTTTTNSLHRCVPVPNNNSSSVLLEDCRPVTSRTEPKTSQNFPNCDSPLALTHMNRRLAKQQKVRKERSQDSTEDEDNNFSDLLNLSVCLPSNIILLENPIQSTPHLHELQQYSVTNSMTGSDISSLANLGTPDSPPRATSPTMEMKELLDKIQQLPQQKSPVPPGSLQIQSETAAKQNRSFYHKMKAKTLYMPLCDASSPTSSSKSKNMSNVSVFSRGWLSRSAPCTPSSNFVPNFPITKSNRERANSKSKVSAETDGRPLLKEHAEESEDEPNNKDENS